MSMHCHRHFVSLQGCIDKVTVQNLHLAVVNDERMHAGRITVQLFSSNECVIGQHNPANGHSYQGEHILRRYCCKMDDGAGDTTALLLSCVNQGGIWTQSHNFKVNLPSSSRHHRRIP